MEALGYEIIGTIPVFLAFEKEQFERQKIMEQAHELGIKLGQSLKEE